MNNSKDRINIYFDGACSPNPGEMGIGVYALGPDGPFSESSVYAGPGTNNLAEWLACEHAAYQALTLHELYRDLKIVIYGDSNLVVNQINGDWKIRDTKLLPVFRRTMDVLDGIVPRKLVSFKWIPRKENSDADRLAKLAISKG